MATAHAAMSVQASASAVDASQQSQQYAAPSFQAQLDDVRVLSNLLSSIAFPQQDV